MTESTPAPAAGEKRAAEAVLTRALGSRAEVRAAEQIWLRSFIDRADGRAALPRLRALLGEMHDQLSSRWPEVRLPEYPALARPGSVPVPVPEWWPPRPGVPVDP